MQLAAYELSNNSIHYYIDVDEIPDVLKSMKLISLGVRI